MQSEFVGLRELAETSASGYKEVRLNSLCQLQKFFWYVIHSVFLFSEAVSTIGSVYKKLYVHADTGIKINNTLVKENLTFERTNIYYVYLANFGWIF